MTVSKKQKQKQMESVNQESAIIQHKSLDVGFYIRSYLINTTNEKMMSGNLWATYTCFIFLFCMLMDSFYRKSQ